MKHPVAYINIKPFDFTVWVVLSNKQYEALARREGFLSTLDQLPKLGARVAKIDWTTDSLIRTVFVFEGSEEMLTIAKSNEPYEQSQLAGLLSHEAVHMFDLACEAVGEKAPSSEFKAYSIQTITQALYGIVKRAVA